jgi:hypothetical protein
MADEFDQYQHERPTFAELQEARRRSQARQRRIVLAAAGVLIGVLIVDLTLEWGLGLKLLFRSSDEWEMLTYRNDTPGEVYSAVYYTGHVTAEEARRLGGFFQRAGLFGVPHTVTVLLSRTGGEYVVSFFIVEGRFDDPELIRELRDYRARISVDVFGGHSVVVQLCEQQVRPTGTHPEVRVRRVIRQVG